jgi:hypothetical protein
MCYYSRGKHPYFILHPLAVEELHPEPHPVLVYHHLLTSLQADLLASIAEPYMRKAAVGKVSSEETAVQLQFFESADFMSLISKRSGYRNFNVS